LLLSAARVSHYSIEFSKLMRVFSYKFDTQFKQNPNV
jgi:hypothetical protein